MRFTVDEIIAGWLNVTFDMGSDVFCVLATDVWKTDSARQLIKACSDALSGEGCYYAVLDNEPGAWVVEINGSGRFKIYLSKEDLKGTFDAAKCEEAFAADIDPKQLAAEIYGAFKPYSEGESRREYENEWMPFPDDEFGELGKKLGVS